MTNQTPDEASAWDAELIEREKDLLVQLVGRYIARVDPEALGTPFLEWSAREARERLSAPERAQLDRNAEAFADRMLRRLELERARVARPRRLPRRSAAPEMPLGELVSLGSGRRHAPILDLGVAAGVGRDLWAEPCAEWLELPDDVPDGRYLALTVRGDSMQPLLHSGDMILLRLGPELERDAVVVFRHPESGYVVKRVGALSATEVELRSFNPAYAPMRVPRDASLVLGTVLLRWSSQGTRTATAS